MINSHSFLEYIIMDALPTHIFSLENNLRGLARDAMWWLIRWADKWVRPKKIRKEGISA